LIATSSVRTPDGRDLAVYDCGDRDGRAVLWHHGTPGTGWPYAPHAALASEQGVRLVSFDRAGYGASTRRAGRSVGDVAGDAAAVADALGIERFVTWGISGGGPHALACAALLGDRVAAATSIAGVAPYGAAGLDFLAGMGEQNVEEFTTALAGEAALRPALEAEAAGVSGLDVRGIVDALRTIIAPVDEAALTGELGEWMVESFARALERGVDGWVDDDIAFTQPWGFDLGAIDRPVLVVQGSEDRMVPYAHGEWLARNVAGAEAQLRTGDGHLTRVTAEAIREVHEWLLAHLAR
jgi:pimeloyl-ACP methyl ester carboxylesterase